MNKEEKDTKDEVIMPTEAGDIGDEQNPAAPGKTDKAEWNYASDEVKSGPKLPRRVKEFLDGL